MLVFSVRLFGALDALMKLKLIVHFLLFVGPLYIHLVLVMHLLHERMMPFYWPVVVVNPLTVAIAILIVVEYHLGSHVRLG